METLKYNGKDQKCLTDAHVERLAQALLSNDKYEGPVEIESNNLSDLAVLALAEVLRKPKNGNITKLNVSHNPAFTHKAGEYIGQALLDNVGNCKLERLELTGVCLAEQGLLRVIDAANKTESLEKLDVGVLTDSGLMLLATRLAGNKHLSELTFSETEDHQCYWSTEARQMFCDLLKSSTQLKHIRAKFQDCNKHNVETKLFQEEIEFYTEQKSKNKKKARNFEDRMRSCDQEAMFQQMLEYLEKKEKNQKMPVRKFYNNSFGQILNDAIFALKKKQLKSTGEEAAELQYHQGQIKFVADYILGKLPAGEMTIIDDPVHSD